MQVVSLSSTSGGLRSASRRWTPLLCWCSCALLSVSALAADGPITTDTLLREMIDTVRLANYPAPSYRTVQYSSYDRRSNTPEGPDWFANSDGFGNEPNPNFAEMLVEPQGSEPGRYLICDVQGPGAIVRTWSAAIEGTIRVVLDGAEEPIFDGPAAEFLQSGLRQLVVESGLSEELYDRTYRQRDACYFPIPFARSCRIEWTGSHRRIHFYEVQIRHYAPAAQVVALQPGEVAALAATIQQVAEVLDAPFSKWPYRSQRASQDLQGQVAPGESLELKALQGPLAVESLSLQLVAKDLDRALRQTVLHINFDGHGKDQVECPVGDFFGAAPGINPYDQVPFTVQGDGSMTCRYVMPFARSCVIRLVNRGSQPVSVSGMLRVLNWTWDPATSMHFRARWRVNHDLVADSGDRAQDLPFVLARGRGVYVGTAIMLFNPNAVPTPSGSWWGEGDEKIFVDDELRPSTYGTGSEDYFNYSWSSPDIFLYPYCGQPRNDGPANRGFVVNQRWHILDALPFDKSIAFFMELYSHERTPNFSYARIAYHYGRPGMIDDSVGITGEDVRHLEYRELWEPAARRGSANSTFFQTEDLCPDKSAIKLMDGLRWAGGTLCVWTPSGKEDRLALELPVESAGRYIVRVTAATGPDSAPLTATLDGQPIALGGEQIPLVTPYRVLLRNFSSPTMELGAGKHQLVLQLAEDRPGAKIGIDFVWIQKR